MQLFFCFNLLTLGHFFLSTFHRYVSVGGNPDMVVDYLSSNYDAIAQTSNLLAEWLLMADISIAEVQTLVEETLKKMIIKYFDPKKADSIFSDETRGVSTITI